MTHTTTASEWAQMVSLAVGLYAAVSSPYFLLVDAEVWAWPHPVVGAVERAQPVVRRATQAIHEKAVYAGHDLNWAYASARHEVAEFCRFVALYTRLSLREAAFTATALLAFLTITPGDAR